MIGAAIGALESGLALPSRADALHLLVQQPALLYDITAASISQRLDALAAAFQVEALT
ncbi:hypothetical protein HaLaN_05567 [Haematococcus lacustris]|uniref:Uncharacterized protein n=1 Tax=Haematococcus lacustris TaxID=44745 RepID=A0A699YU20_HAELA|nr:hypothetical protein HaLaN_05567 [Haematococcus lacustris]